MTATELQALIRSELNITGSTFATEFDANMPLWWNFYATLVPDETIRSLFVKRRAISFLLSKYRNFIKITIGSDQIDGTSIVNNLKALYALVDKEIQQIDPEDSSAGFLHSVDTHNGRDFPRELREEKFEESWCPV